MVGLVVHEADIQDRDGAPKVLASIRSAFPWLRHIFADGGYAGEKLTDALAPLGQWTLEIIKRSDAARGFVLLPRRWVVERTFAWLNRNRRLVKDFEELIPSATAWIWVASVKLSSGERQERNAPMTISSQTLSTGVELIHTFELKKLR